MKYDGILHSVGLIAKCSEIMNGTFRNSQVKFTKSGYFV
jgi:hypothetical protein